MNKIIVENYYGYSNRGNGLGTRPQFLSMTRVGGKLHRPTGHFTNTRRHNTKNGGWTQYYDMEWIEVSESDQSPDVLAYKEDECKQEEESRIYIANQAKLEAERQAYLKEQESKPLPVYHRQLRKWVRSSNGSLFEITVPDSKQVKKEDKNMAQAGYVVALGKHGNATSVTVELDSGETITVATIHHSTVSGWKPGDYVVIHYGGPVFKGVPTLYDGSFKKREVPNREGN